MDKELLSDIDANQHRYENDRKPRDIEDLKQRKAKYTRIRIHIMNGSSAKFQKEVDFKAADCHDFFKRINFNPETVVGSVRAAWTDEKKGVKRGPGLGWPSRTLFSMLIDTINASTAGEKEPRNGKRRVCYLDLYLRDTGSPRVRSDWMTTIMR